jgi:hypothetical protein
MHPNNGTPHVTPVSWPCLLNVMFGLFVLFRNGLVDNDTRNANIAMLTQEAIQFQFQFVKGFFQTAVGTVKRRNEEEQQQLEPF